MIIIDVGAAGEILPRFSNINSKTIVAFEPDPEAFLDLKKKYTSKDVIIINEALSSQEQDLDIYFTEKGECSSIYKPNKKLLEQFPFSERFNVKSIERIKTKTLDSALEENKLKNPNYIKLDIQGAELDALKGGLKSLKSICCVEIEIEFAELYEGQPLFSETEQFLRELGFEVWDIRRTFQKEKNAVFFGFKKGRLVSGDALFFKNPKKLHDDLDELDDNDWYQIISSSIEIAKVYGYSDYVLDLINEIPDTRDKNLINKGLKFRKKNWLTIESALSHHRYKFGRYISSKLFSLAHRIDPYDSGCKTGDLKLGNKTIE